MKARAGGAPLVFAVPGKSRAQRFRDAPSMGITEPGQDGPCGHESECVDELFQIGWLEFGGPSTTIRLTARTNGSRVKLYAGARQNLPIVTHGPFVGETHADLVRVSRVCRRPYAARQ